MSDLSPHEIGRLLEKVDNTERLIHEMSDRITRMEAQ